MTSTSLVIAEPDDQSAFWLFQQLKEAGGDIEFITPADLIGARKWTVWLDESGQTFSIQLMDGRELESQEIWGAINRVNILPADLLAQFSETDRSYGESEFHALFLAFLSQLPGPVLNPPGLRWLGGFSASELEWKSMASSAGMELYTSSWQSQEYEYQDYSRTTMHEIIVADNQLMTESFDTNTASASIKLASLAGCPLLQILFQEISNKLYFHSATPFVNFTQGGENLVNTVQRMLTQH